MEQHEGGIELDSRPGDTTFTLWLPQARDAVPVRPQPGLYGPEE
jgi:nitrogen-specific signal transduction histidine kinase